MIQGKSVVALIQARVSSTRLPKKHFRMIGDKSVLEWILWRLSHVKEIDKVVISTCKESGSELYCQYQDKYDYEVFEFEGNVNDVVGRHYALLSKYKNDCFITISGDSPLVSERLITDMLHAVVSGDYLKATVSLPCIHEGIGCYLYDAIEIINDQSRSEEQRENFCYQIQFDQSKLINVEIPEKEQFKTYRISVDNMADLRFMNAVHDSCKGSGKTFEISNVIDVVKEKEFLTFINSHVRQKQVGIISKKILFLTKASSIDGFGHLSRMIAMAQEENESFHHGVKFLINNDQAAIKKLNFEGYVDDYYVYESDEEIKDYLRNLSYTSIVIDIKGRNDKWDILNVVREDKEIIFYDLYPVSYLGDRYLLQGIQPDDIEALYKNNSKVKMGMDTVFINKRLQYEILKNAETEKAGLLITLGATESKEKLEQYIEKYREEYEKIYVCSGAYSRINSIEGITEVSQTNLYEVMSKIKDAICFYGVTYYELIASGANILECFTRNDIDKEIVNKINTYRLRNK